MSCRAQEEAKERSKVEDIRLTGSNKEETSASSIDEE